MDKTICPECRKATEMVVDYAAGDTVCAECGLVLEQHLVDESSEWRSFSDSTSSDPVRVGGPWNPLLTDGGLSTVISKENSMMSSLGRWQNWGANPDRSLLIAFKSIEIMADRLGLVSTIKDRANEIYKVEDLKSILAEARMRYWLPAYTLRVGRKISPVHITKSVQLQMEHRRRRLKVQPGPL